MPGLCSWRGGGYRNTDFAGGAVALQALQIGTDFRSALIADLAVSFESLADDASQFGWEIWIELQGRRGLLVEDGIEGCSRSVSAERERAGGHLIEDCAERKNISAGIEVFA